MHVGLLVVVVGALLSGCASLGAPSSQLAPGPSLADSKAAAQLVRNDAATHLPEVMVKQVVDLSDASFECDETAGDSAGLMRSWHSGASLLITNSQAARIDIVSQRLVQAYVDNGWTATVDSDGTTMLSKEGKPDISIDPVEKGQGPQPLIRIETTGPCVATDGAGSAEVRELENASSPAP
jgi:hypothetical protein